MANKELKKILHMGAMSVIHCNPEIKQYYERKTAEGKHPLCVINAVKNNGVARANGFKGGRCHKKPKILCG